MQTFKNQKTFQQVWDNIKGFLKNVQKQKNDRDAKIYRFQWSLDYLLLKNNLKMEGLRGNGFVIMHPCF